MLVKILFVGKRKTCSHDGAGELRSRVPSGLTLCPGTVSRDAVTETQVRINTVDVARFGLDKPLSVISGGILVDGQAVDATWSDNAPACALPEEHEAPRSALAFGLAEGHEELRMRWAAGAISGRSLA